MLQEDLLKWGRQGLVLLLSVLSELGEKHPVPISVPLLLLYILFPVLLSRGPDALGGCEGHGRKNRASRADLSIIHLLVVISLDTVV